MMNKLPKIIHFQKIGNADEGYLSVSDDQEKLGFEVKRVFWSYNTPPDISRGRHAHHLTEMVLIAAKGKIKIETRTIDGAVSKFELSDPNEGLYLPKLCWHEMYYTEDALQLVLCSEPYKESDYIRSKEQFEMMVKQHQNG